MIISWGKWRQQPQMHARNYNMLTVIIVLQSQDNKTI